jgi:hypothetical protein
MSDNLQRIFLSYANNLFRNDPQNIQKVYDDIAAALAVGDASKRPQTLREAIVKVIAAITQEQRQDDLTDRLTQLVSDYLKDTTLPQMQKTFPWEIAFLVAMNAVHGYENGYCENECPHRSRRELLGHELFVGEHRIKCHECEQHWFRWMLEKLIDGAEYSKIDGFRSLVHLAENCLVRSIGFSDIPGDTPCKEHLAVKLAIRVPNGWSLDSLDNKQVFNSFFSSLAAYSLVEFLLHNDRRKLKQCRYCHEIFPAKNISNEGICYKNRCRNMQRKMDMRSRREQDPVRYY